MKCEAYTKSGERCRKEGLSLYGGICATHQSYQIRTATRKPPVQPGPAPPKPAKPCDGCGNSAPDSLVKASIGSEMLCPDCKAQEGAEVPNTVEPGSVRRIKLGSSYDEMAGCLAALVKAGLDIDTVEWDGSWWVGRVNG